MGMIDDIIERRHGAEYAKGYRHLREWVRTQTGVIHRYATPSNDYQRGWNAALEETQQIKGDDNAKQCGCNCEKCQGCTGNA